MSSTHVAVEKPRIYRERADLHRQVRLVVVFALVTIAVVWFFAMVDDFTMSVTLGERVTAKDPARQVDAMPLMMASLAAAASCLTLALFNRVPKGLRGVPIYAIGGASFLCAFVIWSFTDQTGPFAVAFSNPFAGSIRLATPLIFGALAGCLCERAGVINIAIEGQFLVGAFAAAVTASLAYSAEMGLVGGVLAGVAMASLLGVFALRYNVNQVVLGVVLIALATGLTDFLLGQIPADPAVRQYLNQPLILERIQVPVLYDLPLVGPALFGQTLLVYIMYGSVLFVSLLLYQSTWGLRARSVGEHPRAAATVGIRVNRIRWQAILFGGLFAGLGGAYFTVGSTGTFDSNASAGNGFIALAAVIMGRWDPVGATLASLLFGFCLTVQAQLAFLDKIPGELLRASPYLVTLIAVAGFVGKVRPPAAGGEPYRP